MFKKKVKYAFYTLGHPSDGFYEIRHRGRGSVGLSILFVFLFAVCFSANRQYAGFVVNNVNPMEINSLAEICAVFLLFFLFCVGNWSITCLMGGAYDRIFPAGTFAAYIYSGDPVFTGGGRR